MSRPYRHTSKLTRLDPTREQVNLILDFEDVDDFLADYDANLSQGVALIETDRYLSEGTGVQLRISFPGLLAPVVIDGVARTLDNEDGITGIRVQLRPDPVRDRLVERIRARDRAVILPVVRVLIVEDNHHVAQLVSNGLAASARRELGQVAFTFTTAEDGAVALELLKQTTFDAAIVDVYLPVLDGPGFIRQARTALGLTDLPIITMSGGGDSARNAALSAGATAFLDKPVRLKQVVDTMRQLIKL